MALDRMHPDWQAYLRAAGARMDDGQVRDFGQPETEARAALAGECLCALTHLGYVRAHGDDAASFLQGQLSNDVTQVDASRSQLTSYCSAKGRMLAAPRLLWRDHAYYLVMPRGTLVATLARLRLFVLRAQVTLEDVSDTLTGIGVAGTHAERRLARATGASPPAAIHGCAQHGELTVVRIPGPQPRYEIYGEVAALKTLWARLAEHAWPVGPSAWRLLDIEAGIPAIFPDTADSFVPQMANLERIGGVSFTKGCYPGQEVVARMHYLGRLKRRMYRLQLDTPSVPPPGAPLFADADEPAGQIVDAQAHPDGGVAALAVLQTRTIDQALRLGTPDGAPARLENLPYDIASNN